MARVAIVIINYNGLADTLRCLESVSQIAYPAFQIIVVDNASLEDPSPAIEMRFPACEVLRLAENRGYAGGANAGICRALGRGAEYVLLLNNDTLVAEAILTQIVDAAVRHPQYGVIGPITNSMERSREVLTHGWLFDPSGRNGIFRSHRLQPIVLPTGLEPGANPAPELECVDIVNGCCMLVARRVFETVGLMDERFFLMHEESDFCLRAGRAGFACGILPRTLVWHAEHASFQRSGPELRAYYGTRNLYLLLRKHRRTTALRSLWIYFNQVRYLHDAALERCDRQTLAAVTWGFSDALRLRFGARVASRGRSVRGMAMLLESARRANHLRKQAAW